MIDGVIITPLKQIFDEHGKVMQMLREDSPVFSRFGEIYFSTTNPGAVKAWHLHKEMTLNYAVISGQIKLVLYDERKDSPTFGEVQELFISPENYFLVTIPPGLWYGFKSVGNSTSIIANCATLPHCQNEITRRHANDKKIPYKWDS